MAQIEFDWDPQKARANVAKHGVSFEDAMGVFADPSALSILDRVSAPTEERWVTLGTARPGLLVVVHTHVDLGDDRACSDHIGASRDRARAAAVRGRRALSDMKDEYDFMGGERGRFFRENARLAPPVHLAPDVQAFVEARAAERGESVSDVVNAALRREMAGA